MKKDREERKAGKRLKIRRRKKNGSISGDIRIYSAMHNKMCQFINIPLLFCVGEEGEPHD